MYSQWMDVLKCSRACGHQKGAFSTNCAYKCVVLHSQFSPFPYPVNAIFNENLNLTPNKTELFRCLHRDNAARLGRE